MHIAIPIILGAYAVLITVLQLLTNRENANDAHLNRQLQKSTEQGLKLTTERVDFLETALLSNPSADECGVPKDALHLMQLHLQRQVQILSLLNDKAISKAGSLPASEWTPNPHGQPTIRGSLFADIRANVNIIERLAAGWLNLQMCADRRAAQQAQHSAQAEV